MADDEGIGGLYRISGIRPIGTARVFPKTHIVRKAKKSTKEEKESKREKSPLPSEEKTEGIDIEV
ncbi:MAG: hypothetical protein HY099_04300 [Nitrospirae bacterium]|nr:hypothetical protein [Nitrospirota bacterium]